MPALPVDGPVGEELSFRFGKGEDGRQTNEGMNEEALEKQAANWNCLKERGK